jgi:hypothetical protein
LERIAAMTAERIDSLRCIVEEQADEETAPRLPSACGGLRVLH